jgi:hypothetical protein
VRRPSGGRCVTQPVLQSRPLRLGRIASLRGLALLHDGYDALDSHCSLHRSKEAAARCADFQGPCGLFEEGFTLFLAMMAAFLPSACCFLLLGWASLARAARQNSASLSVNFAQPACTHVYAKCRACGQPACCLTLLWFTSPGAAPGQFGSRRAKELGSVQRLCIPAVGG